MQSSFDYFIGLINLKSIFLMIIGLSILVICVKYINRFSKQLQDQLPSNRLFILQVTAVFVFILYTIGSILIVYSTLQPPKELLIAFGGSAAVAIGFAVKDYVSSVVAGFVLLFDKPFQVGDRVSFDGAYGEIVGIGLRVVRLVTLDDNLVTIPNSKFVTEVVASGNSGAMDMMVVIKFYLSHDADLRLARSVVQEVVETSRYVYLKKNIAINFSEQQEGMQFWVQLTVKAYVFDVQYEKAFETDVTLRTGEAFKRLNISRPCIGSLLMN